MTPLEKRQFDRLREENEQLLEENARFRAALAEPEPVQIGCRLSPQEDRVLRILIARPCASHEAIMALTFSERDGKETNPNVTKAITCRLRKKLGPLGIKIKNVWGIGYALDPEIRRRLRPQQREAT